MNQNYAPIIIPTLNRCEHLKKCIESLAANELANETEIYIGVDYPPESKYEEGYKSIIEYVSGDIDGFKAVHVYTHNQNLGPRENFVFLLNEVLKKFDRYIYTEDDNLFSKNFLVYMNSCLDYFEGDPSVIAISGYFWPIEVNTKGNILFNSTIYSAWGCAAWIKKENDFIKDISMSSLEKIWKNRLCIKKLRKSNPFIYSEFVKGYLERTGYLINDDKVRIIDLTYSIFAHAKGKKIVYPTISKVRNIGNDGSGEHCVAIKVDNNIKPTNRNYDYSSQHIDTQKSFQMSVDVIEEENIENVLSEFLKVDLFELLKCDIAYRMSLIIGRKAMVRLLKLFS